MYYLQLIVNGVIAGSVYALFAVGLTMTYGVFRFINFAHGELIAWGAYGVLLFSSPPFNWPIILAVLPALVLTVVIALFSDRLVYTPLRQADRITLLIASIGLSFLFRNALIFFFGADLATYDQGLRSGLEWGGIFFTHIQLLMVITAVVFLGGLYLLLTRTLLARPFGRFPTTWNWD